MQRKLVHALPNTKVRAARSPPIAEIPVPSCFDMKYRTVDHGPGVSLAAIAILIVLSAAALKYLGS